MEKMLQLILQKLDGLDAKIDNLERRMDNFEARLDNIERRMDNFEARMDNMQSQLEENTQFIKAIMHRQDETDAKLDAMALDIHKMNGMILANTEKITEMSNVISELQQIEHQQEETLNILSRRSLDQEAKIRRLKH